MTKKAVAKEIRRTTKAEGNCFICNEPLTETHHIIKVSTLAGIVEKFNVEIDKLIIPVVALCPNHHAKCHCLTEDMNKQVTLTEEEKIKYNEIVSMAEYEEDVLEIMEDYNMEVDIMKDLTLYNMEEL